MWGKITEPFKFIIVNFTPVSAKLQTLNNEWLMRQIYKEKQKLQATHFTQHVNRKKTLPTTKTSGNKTYDWYLNVK